MDDDHEEIFEINNHDDMFIEIYQKPSVISVKRHFLELLVTIIFWPLFIIVEAYGDHKENQVYPYCIHQTYHIKNIDNKICNLQLSYVNTSEALNWRKPKLLYSGDAELLKEDMKVNRMDFQYQFLKAVIYATAILIGAVILSIIMIISSLYIHNDSIVFLGVVLLTLIIVIYLIMIKHEKAKFKSLERSFIKHITENQ